MKSNHSTNPTTPSFQRQMPECFAGCTPVSPEARQARGFAGDQESYRNDDGRPGAKRNKTKRGIDPNADMRL